jgi:AcrR family transcriptional regulator
MKDQDKIVFQRKTKKSDETRARILEVALELFRQRGFEQTTMRDIATACGIALGATYYYFGSKEAIVLAYYELATNETRPLLERAVANARNLTSGLTAILQLKLAYYEPNRKFLGALLPHAADPRDPLSPFSEESRHIRYSDQSYFEGLLERTGTALPKDLAPYVPTIFWLLQMAVILFWIYDRSESQQRTRVLISKSLKIAAKLIEVSRLSVARPLRRLVVELLETVLRPAI